MRTGNPTLNKNTFANFQAVSHGHMTIDGTVNKVFIYLLLVVFSASFVWMTIPAELYGTIMITTAITGFILALVTAFKKEWAIITGTLYAVVEGGFVGIISKFFETMYPGIVVQAVGLTFGVMFVLLFVYKARLVKVTQNFRMGVIAATGAIALVYLLSFILGMFGINMPLVHDNGMFGILFSLIVVGIAAMNLVLDFDFIEQGAHQKVPKYMEWYAAFGLIVTLVWLYIEILRLLAKLNSRD